MFFFLSKTLYYASMPLVWGVGLLVAALLTRSTQKRKRRIVFSLVILAFFSNGFISNEAYKLWEYDITKFKDTPKATYGIILTGFTGGQTEDDDRTYFNKGVDRMIHTLQLYTLGKIDTIVITGGHANVLPTKKKEKTESEKIADVLVMAGVPRERILLENKARNTHENALFTAQIIDKRYKSILVTSAFHMRRAKACFEHEGIDFIPFAVDLYQHKRSFTPAYLIIPSETAMSDWARLIHEWIGYVVYDVVGYY